MKHILQGLLQNTTILRYANQITMAGLQWNGQKKMQYSILSLFRETPQMPVIVVTLTGSEEIGLQSHTR